MEEERHMALCKVCNHYVYYEPTKVFPEGNKFYIYCDHCMNLIELNYD